MSELDLELKKTIERGGCFILAAPMLTRVSTVDFKCLVEQALRMNYQHILICAQRKMVFGWKHPKDYHRFYAQSFGMPWFREELWKGVKLDWAVYWKEILRADNVEFFRHAREHLLLFHLSANILSQETLESCDAAKILQYLGMGFNRGRYTVYQLVESKRINTLRLLYERDHQIFEGLASGLQTIDPDVLDFVLSVSSESVNVQWTVRMAISEDLLDLLEIMCHHQKKLPLNQEDLTYAAEEGRLSILQWAHSINPTIKPSKQCISKIMVRGHVKVFEFLYSCNNKFLPAAYRETIARRHTMWHHGMIIKLYEIDYKRVPLELLHRHAMKLREYKVAIWTGDKLYETAGVIIVTKADLNVAIKSEAWLFVRWVVNTDPKLIPSRAELVATGESCCCMEEVLEMKREFLVLLNCLYHQTKNVRYLPIAEELTNQPVEFIQYVHLQSPEHLCKQDLLKLCAIKKTGIDVHKWLSGEFGINVATREMADAAARMGNIEALNWIAEQNPEAFPSEDAIMEGLSFMWGCRAIELLEWVFGKRPETLPDWEKLQEWNYHIMAPTMLQKVKDYQTKQTDQEGSEDRTLSSSDSPIP